VAVGKDLKQCDNCRQHTGDLYDAPAWKYGVFTLSVVVALNDPALSFR
jgi:phage tail protein X